MENLCLAKSLASNLSRPRLWLPAHPVERRAGTASSFNKRGEGGLERDIKRNTRRRRLGSWGSCLPPDPHPLLHGAQVHKYGRWAAFLWCSRLMIARRRCVDPAWPPHRASHLKTRKKTRPGCSCWSGYKREGCRSMMSATHQRISIPTDAQTTDKILAKARARPRRVRRGELLRGSRDCFSY